MASAAQAALLDELMGSNRNAISPSEGKLKWSDRSVCKRFLAGFCPNSLFINTKVDLGPCEKLHDNHLLEKYKQSHRYRRVGYEADLLRLLETMTNEVDRKIVTNKRRLKDNGTTVVGGIVLERKKKVDELQIKIDELLVTVESLGNEGKIEESQQKMNLLEELQRERNFFEKDIELHLNNAKEMEVCEICGAMQVKNDIPLRVQEHMAGRMHIGFLKVREIIEDLKKNCDMITRNVEDYFSRESRRHSSSRKHKSKHTRSRSHDRHRKSRR